jgi:phage baseplate assembly protein W
MALRDFSTAQSSTITFKSAGDKIDAYNARYEQQIVPAKLPIGIKTPISLVQGTLFDMHYDLMDQVVDNLRNLILTNKGERLGNPNFGTDLRKTQFDVANKEEAEIEMMAKIQNAVKAFMPFVTLQSFTTSQIPQELVQINNADGFPGGALSVKLTFAVPQISNDSRAIAVLIPMGV